MEKTAKNLVIVESPNKRATLLKIFKDAGYTRTTVLASVGHISEIKDGGNYWNSGIDPENKFKTNYVVSAEKKDVVENLKQQVLAADKVYICSDPDREGEAIAWSLKKFLKIPEDKYERVTFHEITPKAVLKAFDNPRKIDEDLVDASQSRQRLDKLTGYRLSPVARQEVGAKSVGRCQSACLKLIADREHEILDFVPETYYDLYLTFSRNDTEFKAKYAGTVDTEMKRIPSIDIVNSIIDDCKEHFPFVVDSIEPKEKLSYPKPPFTTSTFQQEVSNKLGIGIKSAMNYAQRLFEGLEINGEHISLITYIRTDSTELAEEFLPVLKDHVISSYGKDYYASVKKAKKSDLTQDGHEAIRPVDMTMTPEKLARYIHDESLLKVYEIIYKRTEACAMAPAITSETTYKIKNGKHIFNLVSRELRFDGYKRAYTYKDDSEDKDTSLEVFTVGEVIDTKNHPALVPTEKTTTPPPRYKESTLVKELESKGIGRPSTFTSIVETVLSQSRGYCTIEDKCIVPTELGLKLSKFLDDSFPSLFSIGYTAEMEKDLDLISDGKLNWLEFLTTFYNNLEKAVGSVEATQKKCPECGKPMKLRKGPYGSFWGCTGYPDCKHIEKTK